MAKIYRVEHYWAGSEEGPAAYLLASKKTPDPGMAASQLQIDWDQSEEDLEIYEEDVHGPEPLILLESVDWELLRKQKLLLLGLAKRSRVTQEEDDALMGIIHLIDEIQDQAADVLDEITVFGEPKEEE